jgi:Protein of unknown function (DUF2950)
MKYFNKFLWVLSFLVISFSVTAQSNGAGPKASAGQRLFASPEEAVKVLQAATEAKDKVALNEIFGPEVKELLTGDEVQDAKNSKHFAAAIAQSYMLVKEGEDKIVIEVGTDNWPMPIPLVKADGQWYFDTAAGKEEIINRHIGKDELHAIGVCRSFAAAQRQHAGANLDVAQQPFHGYCFKILTRQGKAAPGGKMDYVDHGKFIKGLALVAYPAHWDRSGIMTFIVNQDGAVFQRNLGEKSFKAAGAMKEYNPDSKWVLVQDEGVSSTAAGKG